MILSNRSINPGDGKLRKFLALTLVMVAAVVYGQSNSQILHANLREKSNAPWSRGGSSLVKIILNAAKKGTVQLLDAHNIDSTAVPIPWFEVDKRLQVQMPYRQWDKYFDYRPYNEFLFGDNLYRALRANRNERPDISPDAWALIEPERISWYDIYHLYFEYTKSKKPRLKFIHFYGYDAFAKPSRRYIASVAADDAIRVLNASGYLWYRLDKMNQFASDMFLLDQSADFVKRLDSLRKEGKLNFQIPDEPAWYWGYNADSYLRIQYASHKFNEFVVVNPKHGEGPDIVCDTIRYETVKPFISAKAPEAYLLGDALLLPHTVSFMDVPASPVTGKHKKAMKKFRKKINGIEMTVLERVHTNASDNYSFPEQADIISRFNEELLETIKHDSISIPLYASDSLTARKSHRAFRHDIIRIPDNLYLWRSTLEYLGDERVGYGGFSYRALQHHVGKDPGKNPVYWEQLHILSEEQKPSELYLRFDVTLNTSGNIAAKKLTGLGWRDENYESYEDAYLAFLRAEDIRKYLSAHPEKKEQWEKALDNLERSENKYVNMVGFGALRNAGK